MLAFLDDLEETIPGAKDILHPIYRTQSGPRDDQTRTLEDVIANTLEVHGLDASQWGWHREDGELLAAYLDRLRDHAAVVQEDQRLSSTTKQKWKRVVMVIDRQAQITNQAATFSASPAGSTMAAKLSPPM